MSCGRVKGRWGRSWVQGRGALVRLSQLGQGPQPCPPRPSPRFLTFPSHPRKSQWKCVHQGPRLWDPHIWACVRPASWEMGISHAGPQPVLEASTRGPRVQEPHRRPRLGPPYQLIMLHPTAGGPHMEGTTGTSPSLAESLWPWVSCCPTRCLRAPVVSEGKRRSPSHPCPCPCPCPSRGGPLGHRPSTLHVVGAGGGGSLPGH